jgi:hypothetical protein
MYYTISIENSNGASVNAALSGQATSAMRRVAVGTEERRRGRLIYCTVCMYVISRQSLAREIGEF